MVTKIKANKKSRNGKPGGSPLGQNQNLTEFLNKIGVAINGLNKNMSSLSEQVMADNANIAVTSRVIFTTLNQLVRCVNVLLEDECVSQRVHDAGITGKIPLIDDEVMKSTLLDFSKVRTLPDSPGLWTKWVMGEKVEDLLQAKEDAETPYETLEFGGDYGEKDIQDTGPEQQDDLSEMQKDTDQEDEPQDRQD